MKATKKSLKIMLPLFMALIMFMGAFSVLSISGLVAQADDASQVDHDLQKGDFVFAPHTVLNQDLPDYYYYSDHYFDGSAFDYNEHLATMSMIMCAASISSQDLDADYAVKSRNLANLLSDLEFSNFEINSWYSVRPQEQSMGVGMAYRVIGEGENAYTLLAIVPRSAGYQKEWAGNFTVGTEGIHEGFATGRDIILEFAKTYVTSHKDNFVGDVKVWTMGYSRGAGVTNLVAASLVENSQNAIGLDVAQEDIFAYTFGTPSTVQYANEQEREALEDNYANIWNIHSDYDIVTFAPFRNWGFTYYGNFYEMDVYNAEKKVKMLEFLEVTNPVVHEIYTAENSSADPDNFLAVMLTVVDGSPNFVPANTAYGIPNSQYEFLESRIAYLVENLVPDRETYVNEGYEYALQQITSLYFGLSAEEGSAFIGGLGSDPIPLLISYYCYYLSEAHLNELNVMIASILLDEALDYMEQYLDAMALQTPEVAEEEWYATVCALLQSEQYTQLRLLLANPELISTEKISDIKEGAETFAVALTANALANGINALGIEDEAECVELLNRMTSEDVAGPLTKFIIYLLLGHDNPSITESFNPSNEGLAIASTFIANAGRYMRVHNNEILLSWLRTEDSYYTNPPHIHNCEFYHDETEHGYVCECGYKKNVEKHVDLNADGKCDVCGSTMPIISGLSAGAIAGIAVGGTAVAGTGGFAIFWFAIKKKKWIDLVNVFKK